MKVLILDAATAAAVAGQTLPGSALDPVQFADGTFALPVRVLADPAHVIHHQTLRGLPTREASDCAWLEAET